MIRFSAIVSVVAVALGLLVVGAVSGTLALVYLAIGLASLALLMLIAGVVIWRDEIFGPPAESRELQGQGRSAGEAPAAARAGGSLVAAHAAPLMQGGQAGGSSAVSYAPPRAAGRGSNGRARPEPGSLPEAEATPAARRDRQHRGGPPGRRSGGPPAAPATDDQFGPEDAGRAARGPGYDQGSESAWSQEDQRGRAQNRGRRAEPDLRGEPARPSAGDQAREDSGAPRAIPDVLPAQQPAGGRGTSWFRPTRTADPATAAEDVAAASGPGGQAAASEPPPARPAGSAAAAAAVAARPASDAEPAPGGTQTTAGAATAGQATSTPDTEAAPQSTAADVAAGGAVLAGMTVTVVPGIARYHKSDCILIRFLGEDDLETMSLAKAEESDCVPCRACRPDREPAVG